MFSPSMPLAFVDLETTGLDPSESRIAEIGIVTVDGDRVEEWDSLVNPERRSSDVPSFRELAPEIRRRLDGRLFIAHNARFDHGFLKSEFARLRMEFNPGAVCTVALSRRLYPGSEGHNLDALMERHGLASEVRHRALPDARLVWQFWQTLQRDFAPAAIGAAIEKLLTEPVLPPYLDAGLIDRLPETPGVYLFFGEEERLLQIGRAGNLRRHLRDYFRMDRNCPRAVTMARDLRDIRWQSTGGMLGARLAQTALKGQHAGKKHRPAAACFLTIDPSAPVVARFLPVGEGWPEGEEVYGLYPSERKARNALRRLADRHRICPALLGLSKEPCALSAPERLRHLARLAAAAVPLKLPGWPYPGPVVIRERRDLHVVDQWNYRGTARSEAEVHALLRDRPPPVDRKVFELLAKALPRLREGALNLLYAMDRGSSMLRAAEPEPPDFP